MQKEKINNGYLKISVERLTNEDRKELENHFRSLGFGAELHGVNGFSNNMIKISW